MSHTKINKYRKQVNLSINESLKEKIDLYFESLPYVSFSGLCLAALEYYIDNKAENVTLKKQAKMT